jgi:hypothetical protein
MKLVDLLIILMIFVDLGPLGLYKDINNARPRARDSCTSYATENTDYLTHPLSFDLVKDEASYLLVSVYALIKL